MESCDSGILMAFRALTDEQTATSEVIPFLCRHQTQTSEVTERDTAGSFAAIAMSLLAVSFWETSEV
ncbi:hypothetical protein [Bifidobacterium vansinderenii]|uniref:hypothetical protein n=1 Tax=Bifidobacterium vansinderenii TaxID=1984871 RepID=UPI00117887C8|nr:hypothetical protein [Bifidobacterium vansinderenii]